MLTFEQLKKLKQTECASAHLKNGYLFSCFTGLRKSDIVNLRKNNIKDGYLIMVTQKTKVPVKVKLHP